MTESPSRFPWWIVLGAVVLAAGYAPTLAAPFDFTDDGNLVYPAPPGLTAGDYAARWWDKVAGNVEHLGPFRPVLWVHWELFANTFDGNPLAWRTMRFVWCGLAAGGLLWLLRELKLPPTAALLAAAAGMWNPYRNEIWTSLTLAEGVAMPYAMLALIAARKASASERPLGWDLLSMACLFACLGCKNTFVALVPAQLALRLFPDHLTFREGWRANRVRAALYLLPLAMPAIHFVYFKLTWHPGQYETPGPSFAQVGRFASWMKGAAGLDFLAVGFAVSLIAVLANGTARSVFAGIARTHRAAVACGLLLFAAGTAVYLPLPIMAARYTMPAIWGFDILVGVLVAGLIAVPSVWPKRVAWAGFAVGIVLLVVANVGRQEKVMARSRLFWNVLEDVEKRAPANARIAWVGGETGPGSLNVEEGIHFQWHLTHRGRGDIEVQLVQADGSPVSPKRVELPEPTGPAQYRIAGAEVGESPRWELVQPFERAYWFGRKNVKLRLETAKAGGGVSLIGLADAMRTQLWLDAAASEGPSKTPTAMLLGE